MSARAKHLEAAVKGVDAGRRRITAVASQEVVDRDGDVILAAGIDTSDFARNPVLLGDHDPRFVLGRVERWWLERRPEGGAFMFEAELLPAGASARVDEAWAAISFGARKGISIGFLPQVWDDKTVRVGQTGVTFRRVLLMEISSVGVPSCPTCVVEQKHVRGGASCTCGAARAELAAIREAVRAAFHEAGSPRPRPIVDAEATAQRIVDTLARRFC